jgi:hypothetical protein
MSADRAQDVGDLLCGEIAIHQTGDEVVAPHEQHGIVELMAVEGICGGNALPPADPDVGGDLHEQNILGVLGEERCPEWSDERQGTSVDNDLLDPHDASGEWEPETPR